MAVKNGIKWFSKMDKINQDGFVVAKDKYYVAKNGVIESCKEFSSFDAEHDFLAWFYDNINRTTSPNKWANYYEVTKNTDIKLYIDLDIDHDMEFHEDILSETIEAVMYSVKDLTGTELTVEDFLVCQSHRDTKKSYHVILYKYAFRHRDEIKIIMKNAHECMENYSEFIDFSVYSNNRQFRLLHSSKYGINNFKEIVYQWKYNNEDIQFQLEGEEDMRAEISEFYATCLNYTHGNEFINLPKKDEPKEYIEVQISEKDMNSIDIIIENFIAEHQEFSILNRNGNFISLKRNSPSHCKICDKEHENENPYINIWKSTYKTKVMFNCRRSPESLEIGCLNHPVSCFDDEDYYLNEFVQEFSRKEFKTKEEQDSVYRNARRVGAVINTGARMMVTKDSKKDSSKAQSYTTFCSGYKVDYVMFEMDNPKKEGEKCMVRVPFPTLFMNFSYRGIQNTPFHAHEDLTKIKGYDAKMFNLFNKFKARIKSPNKISQLSIDTFEKHVREVLANNDDECYNYIMKWFSTLIKFPRNKIGQTALVFYSPNQQVGKNVIMDFFRDWIFGNSVACDCDGLKSITTKFNANYYGKLLITINEAPTNKDTYHELWEDMKSRITSKVNKIEKKGVDSFDCVDYTRYVITTNNRNSIKIENAKEKRYAVFEVSEKYKDDINYFNEFDRVLNNENGADDIYSYLLNYNTDGFVHQKMPYTQLKADMANYSKPKPVLFMDEVRRSDYKFLTLNDYVIGGDIECKWNTYMKDGVWIVPFDLLYKEYQAWSKDNGFDKPLNKIYFSRDIEIIVQAKTTRINGKLTKCKMYDHVIVKEE